MHRVAVAVAMLALLAACGGDGGGGAADTVQVLAPPSFAAVARDMVELFNDEERGFTAELVGDLDAADAVITDGEAAMQDLAGDGLVEDGRWTLITEKGSTEIWLATLAGTDNPDGALQWSSFASGASPWGVYEDHGYAGG